MPHSLGPPPHTLTQDELFYVLEGEITLIAGSLKTVAKAGTLAYIPAHCIHSFRVEQSETRLLNFYFPGGFEKALTEFGVPATARTLPPPDTRYPGTPEQQAALFQRIGMATVALPDTARVVTASCLFLHLRLPSSTRLPSGSVNQPNLPKA